MMTIVTHVTLKEGSGPEWDAAMGARLAAVEAAGLGLYAAPDAERRDAQARHHRHVAEASRLGSLAQGSNVRRDAGAAGRTRNCAESGMVARGDAGRASVGIGRVPRRRRLGSRSAGGRLDGHRRLASENRSRRGGYLKLECVAASRTLAKRGIGSLRAYGVANWRDSPRSASSTRVEQGRLTNAFSLLLQVPF